MLIVPEVNSSIPLPVSFPLFVSPRSCPAGVQVVASIEEAAAIAPEADIAPGKLMLPPDDVLCILRLLRNSSR